MVRVRQAERTTVRGARYSEVVRVGDACLEELVDVARCRRPRLCNSIQLISFVVVPAVPVADQRSVELRAPRSVVTVVRNRVATDGVDELRTGAAAVAVLVVRQDIHVVEHHPRIHGDADPATAGRLEAFARLRRDDDGSVRGPRTVQCRCSGTFQHGHRLDVVRVQVLDGVAVIVSTGIALHVR